MGSGVNGQMTAADIHEQNMNRIENNHEMNMNHGHMNGMHDNNMHGMDGNMNMNHVPIVDARGRHHNMRYAKVTGYCCKAQDGVCREAYNKHGK